jgi:hypothetical protein
MQLRKRSEMNYTPNFYGYYIDLDSMKEMPQQNLQSFQKYIIQKFRT